MQTWTSFQINHLGAKPPQWGLPNPHNFSKPSRDICVTAGDGGQRGDVGGDQGGDQGGDVGEVPDDENHGPKMKRKDIYAFICSSWWSNRSKMMKIMRKFVFATSWLATWLPARLVVANQHKSQVQGEPSYTQPKNCLRNVEWQNKPSTDGCSTVVCCAEVVHH